MERNYEFRNHMREVHRRDIRDPQAIKGHNTIVLDDSYHIAISRNAGPVVETAALDLQHYLYSAMGVSVALKRYDTLPTEGRLIVVDVGNQEAAAATADGISLQCTIDCAEGRVEIRGVDDRGCAQGCYHLEDLMSQRLAPYLEPGRKAYHRTFSPRMVHSGYGLDNYPDAHLSAIAHAGMDAILIFTKGVDLVSQGYLDFNELIDRAARYGLDVYAYSYYASNMHPQDEGAYAHYDSSYGQLFRSCPGLKGVVLVGESVEFPSRDPRVTKKKYYDNTEEGVHTGVPTAGWFPCEDYGEWISMVRRVIHDNNPAADIVFWTYNWGYAPLEDRLKLIDSLPTDISLMVTFEMFAQHEVDGLQVSTVDYTLSFPGPSEYFLGEAKRAKERGLRLYTQANTAGLTWDFGVIPYEPFPQQWVKRYEGLLQAHADYGLSGVMESHHYGFWPSFVSRIEKMMFTQPGMTGEQAIQLAAEEVFGPRHRDRGIEAWARLSEGIQHSVSTNEDQYGPFRVGPSYPMVFRSDVKIPTVPHARFGGNAICFTEYASDALYKITSHTLGNTGMIQQRIDKEIACAEKMRACFVEGRRILEELQPQLTGYRQQDNARLINLVRFMENSATTVIHVKQWNKAKWQVRAEEDGHKIVALLQRIADIGRAEVENANATLPLVDFDSRLGWEPSMEYICDRAHLEWKIRQTTQVIEQEIPRYIRQALPT